MVLVLDEGRSIASVAHLLGIGASTLGGWVRQARIDRGEREGLCPGSCDHERLVNGVGNSTGCCSVKLGVIKLFGCLVVLWVGATACTSSDTATTALEPPIEGAVGEVPGSDTAATTSTVLEPAADAAEDPAAATADTTTTVLEPVADRLPAEPAAPTDSMIPDQDCVTLTGSEPWIILVDRSEPQECLVVAEFQNVQVWNKGSEPRTVDWPDRERRVASDDHFDTGPIGDVLQAGPNEIDAAPLSMPIIWLLPESLSPTAGIDGIDDGFGPVRVGMTLDEASAALGLELEVSFVASDPPALYPWEAVVSGGPYSPTLLADGPGGGTSVIGEILLHDPRD